MRNVPDDRLLIKDVTALLGEELERTEHSDLLLGDGKILNVSGKEDEETRVIDGRGLIALPGFVNGHIHLNDAVLKDLGIGRKLDDIVHPVSGLKRTGLKSVPMDKRLEAMERSLEEMAAGGITTAVNFHEENSTILKELLKRTPLAGILINLGRPGLYSTREQLERNEGLPQQEIDDFRREQGDYSGAGLSGANEYSDRALEQIAASVPGTKSIHAAESSETCATSLRLTGQSEVERVVNRFHPDFIVHLTKATEDDIQLMVEGRSSAVCCPRSNAILGTGIAPIGEMMRAGIRIGLGTDNMMLNTPDMFREMDYTSRIIRSNEGDPSAVDSVSVLKMATSGGAAAVGIGGRTGIIKEGYDADLVLLDLTRRLAGTHDLYSSIVHRATVADIVGTVKKGILINMTDRIRRVE